MRITVFGSARLTEDSPHYGDARRLGRLLAERGDVIVSGGYGGLMEGVSRGAREAGGHVVGITMSSWIGRLSANDYVAEEIRAATLFARLEGLVESDALIALPGGAGTLAEIALAWNLRQMDLMPSKSVILVGPSWKAMLSACREQLVIADADLALLSLAETVEDAVQHLDRQPAQSGDWRG